MKPARTRIAPSPTGFMHIGTLHTALFDYFLAKQTNGKFIIRIEDTDQSRFVDGAVENLLKTFKRLGIESDEGPIISDDGKIVECGDYGPYVQSNRLTIYKKYVDQLLEQGDAYHCFCSSERLDAMREEQRAVKQNPKYDRHCINLSKDEIDKRIESGEKYVVRMRIPDGETEFEDVVRGIVKFNNCDIDDQVILKSDGFPTYHLAVVVDDALMKITHIIRGEEWLSSTPKHIILYKMLGFNQIPIFAHLPLLLNPDKTKLSKRQGDVAVEDYLNKGYLPEAILNFIGTLGFNPSGDRELYTLEELIKSFDLSKVKKSGAVMNIEKLDWMNNYYIMQLSEDELIACVKPFVSLDLADEILRRALMVEKIKIKKLSELQENLEQYVIEIIYGKELLAWKKSNLADAKAQLEGVLSFLTNLDDAVFVNIESLEREVRAYILNNNLDNGCVLWPLRVALSGKEKSASPFELLWIFGREKSVDRINKAIKVLG
jgi:glutamyl-tRNA synthetase